MRIGMIWAQAKGGAIGRDGTMPWHLPEDLAHFKTVTMGAPVIMGRRTWDSLPEAFRPLPGRENVVVTRSLGFHAEGAHVAGSLTGALEYTAHTARDGIVWIMGGGQLYREAMAVATELVVTHIDLDVPDADTFAPDIDAGWRLESRSEPFISEGGLGYVFERYVRPEAEALVA